MAVVTVMLAVVFAALTGCTVSNDDFLLDHAQILAVRADPPTIPPGGRARIDVLAGDTAGAVYVADPDVVTIGDGSGSAGSASVAVTHEPDGWYVTAPELAGATGSAVVVELPLFVVLTVDGDPLPATKDVAIGAPATNPTVESIDVDGATTTALTAAVGTKPTLTATTVETGLTYAWYTSVGTLSLALQPTATLDATTAATGLVLVVVRDDAGGVGWLTLSATVK
jgi:hypothetical protein